MSRQRVVSWIREKKLEWKVHFLGRSVRTVKVAASDVGVSPNDIIKTVIVVCGGNIYACIVPGDKKLSYRKLSLLLECSPRLAKPREVLESTGYSIGGVPPAPLPDSIQVVVDERVVSKEKVWGGGGDEVTLLEFNPREYISIVSARVADISE